MPIYTILFIDRVLVYCQLWGKWKLYISRTSHWETEQTVKKINLEQSELQHQFFSTYLLFTVQFSSSFFHFSRSKVQFCCRAFWSQLVIVQLLAFQESHQKLSVDSSTIRDKFNTCMYYLGTRQGHFIWGLYILPYQSKTLLESNLIYELQEILCFWTLRTKQINFTTYLRFISIQKQYISRRCFDIKLLTQGWTKLKLKLALFSPEWDSSISKVSFLVACLIEKDN